MEVELSRAKVPVRLLDYIVDVPSLPSRINLLRKKSTVSASIILEDNKFQESFNRHHDICEKNCFRISNA